MSWKKSFWSLVRDYQTQLGMLWMFLVFMLVLTAITLLFGEPGTESYTLAVVNLIIVLCFGSIVSAVFWMSIRRERSR
jgi:ABC-type polysaccharide/polyol phosphate export permease